MKRDRLINRSVAILVATFAIRAIASGANASLPDPNQVVELPPFRVLADMLTIAFRADHNGIVAQAEVTQVTPNSPAAQRDIELHDELVSIDDTPVMGAQYDKVSDLIGQDLKPGAVLKLSFVGQRGFFGQRHIKYEFVILRRAVKSG